MMKKRFSTNWIWVLTITSAVVLGHEICFADILYLKNGNKMEGTLQKVSDGVWFEGMHFSHSEVDRIEQAQPEPVEKKSWFDQIMANFSPKKEDSTSQPSTTQKAGQPKAKRNIISQMFLGPADEPVAESLDSYQGRTTAASGALQRARMIQDQVNQQNRRMQEEIMRAEGYYDEEYQDYDTSGSSYKKKSSSSSYKSKSSSSDNSNYGSSSSRPNTYRSSNKMNRSRPNTFDSRNIGRIPDVGP